MEKIKNKAQKYIVMLVDEQPLEYIEFWNGKEMWD